MSDLPPPPALCASVTSPDGTNTLKLLSAQGQLYYAVERAGQTLLMPQPIGLTCAQASVSGAWGRVDYFTQQLAGEVPLYTKRSRFSLEARGARVELADGFALTLLATNQGVAYRWHSAREGALEVRQEHFAVQPAAGAELLYAYGNGAWQSDPFQNSWESLHRHGPLAEVDAQRLIYLPLTVLFPGAALAVTEAELRDYPGLNLMRPEGGAQLTGTLARWPTACDGASRRYERVTARADYLVRTAGRRDFPWRVFLMGDGPEALYESDLVMALSEPSTGDFGWVRPGQVAWEWWNNWGLEGTPFPAGVNTATYCAYIDFAADFGIEYVIMDEGWAQGLDVLKIVPEIDLEAILAHAQARGVGIILWCTWQQLIGRQEEIFGHYARLGVKGFKTDFVDRDDAQVARFLYETAAVAAKYHLLLDCHGIHKPTGLSRTFPNVLSYEGVYGLEQTKWTGNGVDFITNDLRIPFTRLLAGPADYTPGAMRNAPRTTFRADYRRPMSMGTRCRQAALFLIYDSAIRMLCDSPSAYRREPAFTRLIAACPTTFDETCCERPTVLDRRLLVGRRAGREVWYAALAGNASETFGFTPRWLEAGVDYELTLVRDSAVSEAVGSDYILEQRTLRAGETLEVRCARGGGFLLRLRPKPAQ